MPNWQDGLRNFRGSAIYLLVLVILLLLSGCKPKEVAEPTRDLPETLRDLAYDAGGSGHVYLQESGSYASYLVLTQDYGGNCLLLREYLLDEPRIYNGPGRKASYYGESDIDHFLNEEFIHVYPDGLRQHMAETNIEIAAKESIGHCGEETTVIQRVLFLLSYAELDGTPSRTILKEGSSLLYFSDKKNRIAACYEDGKQGSWWLRSASTSGTAYACGVSAEGVMGSSGIYDPNPDGGYFSGVRPALCFPGDMVLCRTELGYIVKTAD